MSESTERQFQRATELHRQGRRAEAIAAFQALLAGQPGLSEGWYQLGYLLKAEGRYEEALEAYASAIRQGVRRAEEVHLNCAVILSDHMRREAEAERALRDALAIDADYIPALLNLGNLHEEHGRREEALGCYDRILKQQGAGESRYADLAAEALARSARLRPPQSTDDPLFQRLHEAAADAVRFDHTVRANVLFATGASYERLGAFAQAFDAFAKANRCLQRMVGRSYDRGKATQLTQALIDAFPATDEADANDMAIGGPEPVFICGMFRSGSTLIEQVLGAHPRVTPGGELNFLLRLAAQRLAPFPQSVASLERGQFKLFAREYLAHLAKLFPDAEDGSIITDKRPDNYLLIGFIKLIFPNAKIVHTTRHPMGNGLSIYQQHLNPRVAGYSTDLSTIGHHYGEYRRLMTHWKSLHADSIHDFDYDAFVGDPRPELESLLTFLGLEWDERCLAFHELRNAVKTGSYWQVREPLHSQASSRWRSYAAFLGPLANALQSAGVQLAD